MGGSLKGGSVTVGYRYFMTIHMGLCRGPIDEVVEIKVGDKTAWPKAEGSSGAADSPITDDRVTSINAGELFGGDKKEGGVKGTLTVCMGKATQVFPAWVKALIGGNVPDFRGVCTMVFDGMICALNPYPKTWAIRMRRTTKGWDGPVWQPSLAVIWLSGGKIKAMNPAHILYECATNRDWGRGLPRSRINEAEWLVAATTLYNEGFGLCLRWNRQTELQEFVQSVLDHIGGAVFTDRETGLLTLKLFRSDYDPETLPLYDYNSGLLSIEPEASTREGAVNEVIVKFTDPLKNEARAVRAQNLASIQSLDSRNSTTTEYNGLPTLTLASRVAQRDLKASTAGAKRYQVILDRRAWRLYPGAVFRVSAPEKGIENVVLRAGKVEDGSLTDGKITVTALFDVFGLSSSAFVSEEESGWSPPDPTPLIAENRHIREATYADLVRTLSPADLALVAPTSGAITTLAARPSAISLGYGIYSRIGAEDFIQRGSESWAPMVVLSAAAGAYSDTLSFSSSTDIGLAAVGTFMQMGNEIVAVDAITLDETGLAGTLTVTRGCIDTIPAAHASGTKCYFMGDALGHDAREYALGESADVKIITRTSSAELDLSLAPTDTINVVARQGKPYPPGAVFVADTSSGVWTQAFDNPVITGDFSIQWAHRDRLSQQDQIVGHWEPNVGPEAGTTYNLRFYNSSNTLLRNITGITANNRSFDSSYTDLVGNLRVELESVRAGYVSFQKYSFTFSRTL